MPATSTHMATSLVCLVKQAQVKAQLSNGDTAMANGDARKAAKVSKPKAAAAAPARGADDPPTPPLAARRPEPPAKAQVCCSGTAVHSCDRSAALALMMHTRRPIKAAAAVPLRWATC